MRLPDKPCVSRFETIVQMRTMKGSLLPITISNRILVCINTSLKGQFGFYLICTTPSGHQFIPLSACQYEWLVIHTAGSQRRPTSVATCSMCCFAVQTTPSNTYNSPPPNADTLSTGDRYLSESSMDRRFIEHNGALVTADVFWA